MNSHSEKYWKDCIFCIFDAPDQGNNTYEGRIEFLKQFSKENNWSSFLRVIDTVKCEGQEHLNKFLREIVEKKGEGVMLREPGSHYTNGRSNSMRKVKEYFDTEVRVLRNMYPHGFDCEQ